MAVKPEVKKAYVKAKLDKLKEKKGKGSLPPLVRKPYDPENALLSKAEFIEKWAKKDEEDKAAKEFVAKRREVSHPAIMEEVEKPKRRKKVED